MPFFALIASLHKCANCCAKEPFWSLLKIEIITIFEKIAFCNS